MNNQIKILIGAIVGGGFGYFVGSVIVEIIKLKEDQLMEEVLFEIADEEEPRTVNQTRKKKGAAKLKGYTEYFKSQNRPELAELAAKYNGENVTESKKLTDDDNIEIDGFIEELNKDFVDLSEEKDPSIISLAEYANNNEGLEAITLNYFDDDVVTDEHDNPINRPEDILGPDALVSFGQLSEDEDIVYVRNLTKKALYEVVRTNKNYAAPVTNNRTRSMRHRRTVEEENENDSL